MNFGDARIFDFKDRHFPERQIEQDGEEHADDAAVTNDGDGFAGSFGENLVERNFHALAEFGNGFGAFDRAVVELMKPRVSADAVFLENFIPAQPGPGAEVDFAEAVQEDGFEAGFFGERGERLLDAAHGARIHDIGRRGVEEAGDGADLFVAERGKFHVDAAAENSVVSLFDLTVADEVEAG